MSTIKPVAISAITAVSTLGVPLAASALGPESVYFGGNLGYHRFEDRGFAGDDGHFDDANAGWKARLGVQSGQVFGAEVGYVDFGGLDDGDSRVDSEGVELALTATIPLTGGFQPYGKLGQLFWDSESAGAGFGTRADSGEDLFYGVGARFDVAPNLDIRLDYDRYALDQADVDLASVGLDLSFY